MNRTQLATGPSAVAVALVLFSGATRAGSAGEISAGAYCPLPAQGERPACLEPARAEYGEFFNAVERGALSDAAAAQVEATVAAGADSDQAYLALSSLAYGYWQLSKSAVAAQQRNPELVERLERWNALLGMAYDDATDDEAWRRALRSAAKDLQRRAPPIELRCIDDRGETHPCDSTDAVMRGIDAAAGRVGLRGALERLLQRILGSEAS
ncbi:MAG: hypothetical protein IH884_15380 [Myxococcales bacterium]|nr:hypothetical protein [Myxococcales bacterium]